MLGYLGFILFIKNMMLLKIGNKSEKNSKYYRKCSNNFAADCKLVVQSMHEKTVDGRVDMTRRVQR